jgi:acetyl esterase/lipase
MCTYITETLPIEGSAKGAAGWIKVTDGSVYPDHPVHAPFGHTLNIDFLAPELGPSGRVAVEKALPKDRHPSPAEVAELEEALKAAGKTYEFHSYEGAGHGFFAVNRPACNVPAATDGWARILAFYGKYL